MANFCENFDVTKEELNRIGDALKDKEFLQIFNDYCKEITDPENVKTYQTEMTQLERERGVDVTFLNPEAGFVIKTSVDGNRKAYVNICYNDNVEKPSSDATRLQNGQVGRNWRVPHMLVPPRDDFTKYDDKTTFCTVYDVIFHSYTLHLAARFTEFRKMVIETALDSIEQKFNLKLDRKNLKYPKKLTFKSKSGQYRPSVIRKPIENFVKPTESDPFDEMFPHPFQRNDEQVQSNKSKPVSKQNSCVDDASSKYTTPKYVIKQRSEVDLQDFRYSMTCRLNATIPKELLVEVDLPLLNSTADCELDVTEKSLILISEKPAKYKLEIQLPYSVNETSGNAKFDKSRRKLLVTLPVVRSETPVMLKLGKEDSGVESDHDSQESLSPAGEVVEPKPLISEISSSDISDDAYRTNVTNNDPQLFLDPTIEYVLPEYTHNVYKNILAFTLHVKNVEPVSVAKKFIQNSGIHVKFTSVGTGFYPVYYAFCAKFLSSHTFNDAEVSVEAWDNNVIVQIPFDVCDTPLCSYLTGLDEHSLSEHKLSEPLISSSGQSITSIENDVKDLHLDDIVISTKYSDNADEVTVEVSTKINERSDVTKPVDVANEIQTLQKAHSYSESSGDELSMSQSPAKSKGILKHRRRTLNRSISESSVDDCTFTPSSFDPSNIESNICIPEERSENESSFKKTVRFNDHVSKQIFRMNSSILGQKKKNQRKSRNKKRSNERRHSESELSETDDKKEQFLRKTFIKERGHHSESELSEMEHHKEFYKKPALKTSRKRIDSGISSDAEKDEGKEEKFNATATMAASSTSRNQIQSTNIDFKSDLIFDLDI